VGSWLGDATVRLTIVARGLTKAERVGFWESPPIMECCNQERHMSSTQSDNTIPRPYRVAHSINGAAAALGVGRDAIYHLIRSGRLKAKKLGKRTLVLDEALRDCANELPDMRA
jgi:excisionase family DNA binding protein